jgi:hypothetical protein
MADADDDGRSQLGNFRFRPALGCACLAACVSACSLRLCVCVLFASVCLRVSVSACLRAAAASYIHSEPHSGLSS